MQSEVPSRILIGDDQGDVLEALRLLLKPEGYVIDTASSPQQVTRALELKDYDVVLIDLNYSRDTTSGEEGLDLLKRIRLADESLPVVVMTAWGSVDVAVDAMRHGARDFIQKPWDNERLLAIARTQTALGRAIRLGRRLELANQALMADGDVFDVVITAPTNTAPTLVTPLADRAFKQGATLRFAVPAGAFADPDFPAPQVSVYDCRRHPWVQLPPVATAFDKDPS